MSDAENQHAQATFDSIMEQVLKIYYTVHENMLPEPELRANSDTYAVIGHMTAQYTKRFETPYVLSEHAQLHGMKLDIDGSVPDGEVRPAWSAKDIMVHNLTARFPGVLTICDHLTMRSYVEVSRFSSVYQCEKCRKKIEIPDRTRLEWGKDAQEKLAGILGLVFGERWRQEALKGTKMSEQNKPLWAREGVTLPEEAKREIAQGMRDSEELAYRLFCANCQYEGTAPDCMPRWDEVTEYAQKAYLLEANAAIEWLFEHGRIAKFIPSHEALEAMHGQFKAYLAMKALEKMSLEDYERRNNT